jgi:hypothetical protein
MPETGGRGRRDLGREVGRRAFGSKELERGGLKTTMFHPAVFTPFEMAVIVPPFQMAVTRQYIFKKI